MPPRDPGVHLEDIEHYAAAAVRFTAGYSLEQYLSDEKTRAAVERALEVCGEAMRKLHAIASDIADKIPYARDIIGFRNILAHGYAELDQRKVIPLLSRTQRPGIVVVHHAPTTYNPLRSIYLWAESIVANIGNTRSEKE